jgi:iron complex outermembrane receptor protein
MKKLLYALVIILPLITSTAQVKREQKKSADTVSVTLEQITVTATRYTEKVMEIPYAVSVITPLQLKQFKGYGLDEALSSVPGVLAQSRAGNQDVRLVIRGFGARGAGDRSNSGTSRGIRVMVDGIPETEPDGRTSFDLVDLSSADNIEVIRSNASATWGNAAGGVINISTMPSASESFVSVRGMGGSFGFNQVQVQNFSSYNKGKLFVSLSNSNYSGWRDHSGSYRTLFNAGFNAYLSDKSRLGVYAIGTTNLFHIPGPLTQKQYDADPEQANTTYLQRDERRFNRLGRIGVTFEHEFDDINSISAMAYLNSKFLQRSERGTFRDFTRYHTGGNFIYKNELAFSDKIKNLFVAGADEAYQDGAILFYSLSASNGRGTVLKDNKREGANNFGAFAQDEIIFNDKLSVIVGARYDKITYYSESFIDTQFGLQEKSFEKLTPKAGISYRLTPALTLYGNMGGGVEVPAGNETDPAGTYGQDLVYLINPLLEPIKSTTYEAGIKHLAYFGENAFLKTISCDAAFYFIDVQNDIIPYRGGRFYFTAGKTNRTGVEIGANMLFDEGFSFQGAFTYSNDKYKEYMIDSVHYGKANAYADYKDNKVAGIPDLFYNLGLKYAPRFLHGTYISVSMNGMGKYFADDANTLEVPSYTTFNAAIGIEKPITITGALAVRGFLTVNNIFDTGYVSSAFINPDIVNGEAVYLEPGLPRNIVLSISFCY